MTAGTELLIADDVDRDRDGLRELFESKGFVCTTVESGEDARGLITRKYFPVALVDLDLDGPHGGLELVRFVRARSKATSVIVLAGRASFEGAVEAFRIGAADVVRKVPDQLEQLVTIVGKHSARNVATHGDSQLLQEVRAVLDESFKVMLGLSRKVYSHLSLAAAPLKPRVMVVDGDPEFLRQLSELIQKEDWDIGGEMTGGAALDRGMSSKLDIVACRDELPDLRGSMVLRSIQTQHGEVLGLLYSAANEGRIDRMEQGQIEEGETPFTGAAHLVRKIRELANELGTRTEERRFIQAFGADHRDFLRRYAELKLKIDRLVSE